MSFRGCQRRYQSAQQVEGQEQADRTKLVSEYQADDHDEALGQHEQPELGSPGASAKDHVVLQDPGVGIDHGQPHYGAIRRAT